MFKCFSNLNVGMNYLVILLKTGCFSKWRAGTQDSESVTSTQGMLMLLAQGPRL